MVQVKDYDFSGYATKNDLKCSDGRIIRKDAFKHNDGKTVPLVWQHIHNEPGNVLGHAILENREDGVYAYCFMNDTPNGQNVKKLVKHGDITNMSIYANDLIEKSKEVLHGEIRELSLVMSGANKGAVIDNIMISHADGGESDLEDEAVIYTGENIDLPKVEVVEEKKEEVKEVVEPLQHAAADTQKKDDSEETVEDVLNTFTEKQKNVMYYIIGQVMEDKDVKPTEDIKSEAEAEHSATANDGEESKIIHSDEGESGLMKENVFDKATVKSADKPQLTRAQFTEIMSDAMKRGSLKDSFLAHAVTYGIENIDYLFPDATKLDSMPSMVQRDMTWVAGVLNSTYHSRFSRIKTVGADITADAARAKGYVKGALKKEEIITLLRRTTTPTTIYKKQKLDRDDVVDITDLDVVAWLKAEMRMMLDEEIARALLVSDGRAVDDADKIAEANIRPIYKDDEMYAFRTRILSTDATDEIIEKIIRGRVNYRGSGNPTFYTTSTFLTDMLLLKDSIGRRLFANQAELESTLRVAKIVEVPVMDNISRTTDDVPAKTLNLLGIMVNLRDYTLGATNGGQVSMFDDFDIDYNQYKYLIETRCCGALTQPKSAMVVEQEAAG